MTEQLVEKIRSHAEGVPVPELDVVDVIRRGRRVGRRRSVTRRTIATMVVGALAGSVVVAAGRSDGDQDQLEVTTSIAASDVTQASAAYRSGGAFSRGDTLWFRDPTYSVDLGVTIQLMLYTADGVVAGVTDDDAGDVKRDYVYVGTDGSVRTLDLPGDIVPGTDAQADRFAYLTTEASGFRIHVVEASSGRELASLPYDARYTWAGWDVPPIGLTGDHVVIGVDSGQEVVDWRTGERVADVPGTQVPSTGGGRALGSDIGDKTYRVGDSKVLRSTTDLATVTEPDGLLSGDNVLSPDGRFVESVNTSVEMDDRGRTIRVYNGDLSAIVKDPVVYVTEVDSGRRITLPGHAFTYGWTPDGRLMRVDGTKVTTCDASTGECTSTTVPDGAGRIRMAGRYLGS